MYRSSTMKVCTLSFNFCICVQDLLNYSLFSVLLSFSLSLSTFFLDQLKVSIIYHDPSPVTTSV